MRTLEKDETIGKYFWLWPLFCFLAGFINSGGYLACHRFVSHITGFGTRVGMEFLRQNFLLGAEMLLIPVGFITGCSIASYYGEFKKDRFFPLFLMIALLATTATLGVFGFFGEFGEPLKLQRDFFLLFLLCLLCGLQNGALASLSQGLIRTTHMTGVATDIGIGLVKTLKDPKGPEKDWLKLRFLKLSAFAFGAMIGYVTFKEMKFSGFYLAACLTAVLTHSLRRAYQNNIKNWKENNPKQTVDDSTNQLAQT